MINISSLRYFTGKSTKSAKYGGEENTYEVPHVFTAHTKSRDQKQNGGGYFLAPNGYYGVRRWASAICVWYPDILNCWYRNKIFNTVLICDKYIQLKLL